MGETCIGESPWVKSIWVKHGETNLMVKRTYIGQKSLGEKFEKPAEEESRGEKCINLNMWAKSMWVKSIWVKSIWVKVCG